MNLKSGPLTRVLRAFRSRSRLLALVIACVAAVSCGIEVYVFLYPVILKFGEPTEDAEFNRFKFRTSDDRNAAEAGPYFKGFEIYYRIYNDKSVLTANRNAINAYNANNPALAYNYLIGTKDYRRLIARDRAYEAPLIPGAAVNRLVEIRFFDFNTILTGTYVRQDIATEPVLASYGPPRRSVVGDDSSYPAPFDFDDIDKDDDDVTFMAAYDDIPPNVYVHGYVLAYGFDSSYKQLYSEVFDLGYVTIEDN